MSDSPKKKGWRGKSSSGGGAVWSDKDEGGVVSKVGQTSAEKAALANRVKLIGYAAVLVALVVILYWILIPPRQVVVITAVATNYDLPLGPNALAREDIDLLTNVNSKNIKFVSEIEEGNLTKRQLEDFLKEKLGSERHGGPNRDVIAIYLSAHGVVNEDGEPCLVLAQSNADEDPRDESNWFAIRDLIKTINSMDTLKPTKKLLILDCSRGDENWRMGQLVHGFAAGLEQISDELKASKIYVLNSTRGTQRGWSAPELNGSVFGYYVAAGLSGHARNGDNKITLLELASFVESHVSGFVADYRDDLQQPTLIPAISQEEDFPVTFASAGDPALMVVAKDALDKRLEKIKQHDKKLAALWKKFEQLVQRSRTRRIDPVGLAELEQKLLRAEKLSQAGSAYVGPLGKLFESIEFDLDGRVGELHLPQRLTGLNLPFSAQIQNDDIDSANAFETWMAAKNPPADEKKKSKPKKFDYLTAASSGLDWLAKKESPTRDDLQSVLQFVDESRGGRTGPDVVEVVLVKLLERYNDWDSDPTGADIRRAIVTRLQSEALATPADLRAHHWLTPLLNDDQGNAQIDSHRRMALDWFFIADEAAQDEANRIWNETKTLVATAENRRDQTQDCYRSRDDVWGMAPYLAKWLTIQLQHESRSTSGKSYSKLLDALTVAIRTTQEMAAKLDRSADEFDNVVTDRAAIEASIKLVIDEFRAELRDLSDDASRDASVLRRIDALMQTPVMIRRDQQVFTASERRDLRTKLLECMFRDSADLGLSYIDNPATLPETNHDDALQRLAKEKHIIFESLGSEHLSSPLAKRNPVDRLKNESSHSWLSRQSGHVRRLLRELHDTATKLEDETNVKLNTNNDSIRATRVGASQSDQLTRAAAVMLARRTWDDPSHDPAHRLQRVDLYFQVLWHWYRTLNDFFGPDPTVNDSDSYFVEASKIYRRMASELLRKKSTAHSYGKSDQLRDFDLLAQLNDRIAERNSVSIRSQSVSVTDEVGPKHSTQIDWSRLHQRFFVDDRGASAVFFEQKDRFGRPGRLIPVKDESESSALTRRYGFAKSRDAQSDDVLQYEIPLSGIQFEGSKHAYLRGIAFLRGHQWPTEFVASKTRIDAVGFVPEPTSPTSITVRGDRSYTGHVMFIVDCSHSMELNKFVKRAQTSLMTIVNELKAEGGDYEIGLRCYGRRHTWKDPKLKDGEAPDTDVEKLVEMGQLDADQVAAFNDAKDRLRGYGATPLYYALKESMDRDFDSESDEPQTIVLITDGVNYQKKRMDSADQVREVWTRQGEKIHVFMVLLPGDDHNADQVTELKELALDTDGAFANLTQLDVLTSELRKALKLRRFVVTKTASDAKDPIALGKSLDLKSLMQRTRMSVSLTGNDPPEPVDISVEGGEGVLIEYDKRYKVNELRFPRFDPSLHNDSPADEQDFVKVGDDEYLVQPLLGRRDPRQIDQVSFQVYVERNPRKGSPKRFTPRPKHVWAEIRPQTIDGEDLGPVYHCFDPNFVANRPVPVFNFVVPKWPKDGATAKINVWFKFSSAGVETGEKTFNLKTQNVFQVADQVPGVDFQVVEETLDAVTHRLRVKETHENDLQLLALQVHQPPTGRISHLRYVGSNEVEHFFDYKGARPPGVVTFRVTSREQIVADALKTKPLIVRIRKR